MSEVFWIGDQWGEFGMLGEEVVRYGDFVAAGDAEVD